MLESPLVDVAGMDGGAGHLCSRPQNSSGLAKTEFCDNLGIQPNGQRIENEQMHRARRVGFEPRKYLLPGEGGVPHVFVIHPDTLFATGGYRMLTRRNAQKPRQWRAEFSATPTSGRDHPAEQNLK